MEHAIARQPALRPDGSMPNRAERGLNRIRGPQTGPGLRRKLEECQQLLPVFLQTLRGLRVLSLIRGP